MKAILTLIISGLISVLAMAGEKKRDVKVTSTGDYIIIIDGKRFNNEKRIVLNNMERGIHYIDVFKKKKGLFGSKYRLVSSKQFELGKKDLDINVNPTGYITIGKQEKGWDGDYWLNKDKSKKD